VGGSGLKSGLFNRYVIFGISEVLGHNHADLQSGWRKIREKDAADSRKKLFGSSYSDIGGVGWPAATPGPGPSLQWRRLPMLPPLPPCIGSGAGIGRSGETVRMWGGRGDERCQP
jgi:hypothetical protein